MRRRARADSRRAQRVPLATRPQDEQYGIHRGPVGYARIMAPEWMPLAGREQWFELLPKVVRDSPAVIALNETHQKLVTDLDRHGKRLRPSLID
jgi:hypothetical protein